jgi:hypothetical protein
MKKIGLGIICLILSSSHILYAHGAKQQAPIVRLSDLDTSNVTCEELLKNGVLVSADRSWEVTMFTMTFIMPDGKLYGPYHSKGAAFNDAEIKMIKKLKKNKAEITIDDIKLIHNGKEKFTLPISLRYNN